MMIAMTIALTMTMKMPSRRYSKYYVAAIRDTMYAYCGTIFANKYKTQLNLAWLPGI